MSWIEHDLVSFSTIQVLFAESSSAQKVKIYLGERSR